MHKVIYPVSRALIGKRLADQLKFPPNRLPFTLFWYRLDQFVRRISARLRGESPTDFQTLLMASAYDESGLNYKLPDHVHDERSTEW